MLNRINKHKDRFLARIKVAESGCHEFIGATEKEAYGRFYAEGRYFRAHRFSWMIHKGAIHDGLLVCHSCDNPPCVNIDHLWLGTKQDNNRDRDAKSRAKGVSIRNLLAAKMTKETALNIIKLLEEEVGCAKIARMLNVSNKSVMNIKQRTNWRYLPANIPFKEKPTKIKLSKTCLSCSNSFTVLRCRLVRSKFCSTACYFKSKKGIAQLHLKRKI